MRITVVRRSPTDVEIIADCSPARLLAVDRTGLRPHHRRTYLYQRDMNWLKCPLPENSIYRLAQYILTDN